ncbi:MULTISPECIES: C39 family peptidase [Staphylococcus]|uniref:Peptidase C39-like domain-containing protein n=1 Tax=Staphylococcus shinii TaxID=2912228 RepID=A0A418IDS0_9STAP|nr:C39 family peptidase [Staphylococcus shinii]MDW8565805.1 C39 family peptidase [Staphylococcus shinii]MDW8566313.1 C39 family peptidase [Staphylococcus shinii]MDW8569234.1 C39 family peptidase [Staphylococcus shinii]MDW8572182.1 C39 family peptidase [Staphylococcus shinii]MEC5300912.1 C39 family peptidase [Staphylococcus shinii]
MKLNILPVKPISQLFPIPMVMGCEGVSTAMMLQFNQHKIPATQIMKHWPKHKNNPYKGYVGHHLWIKWGHHQTIFPSALVPHLKRYDQHIIDSTGQSLTDLCAVLDSGQPVVIYHTVLGQRPLRRTYKLDNQPTKLVSNIHVTLLIGYDDNHYYYIDPLWSHIGKSIVFPALIPNKYQVIKIRKSKLAQSYNAPGRLSFHIQT